MTKAILVIDMPNVCGECKLKYLDTGDDAYFGANVYRCVFDNSEIAKYTKQYDCPLKPMPEKTLEAFMDFDKGFNYCVDTILGKEE